MKEMLFLLFILGGITLLFLMMKRSGSRAKKSSKQATQSDRLVTPDMMTPGNNVLSHNRQVWQARRKRLQKPHPLPGQTAYYARFEDEPEYDGYSRRDRQHLTPAHIKDEADEDYMKMSSIRFKKNEGGAKPPGETLV